MGGVCYVGIPTPEIVAVARVLRIKVDQDLLECVRTLEGAAAPVYNAKKK